MRKNTWGLAFTKVNIIDDKFELLLGLNTGNEEKTKDVFDKIKSEFKRSDGEPDCVIDLLDQDDSIVDDYSVTKKQAIEIASRLGHTIV